MAGGIPFPRVRFTLKGVANLIKGARLGFPQAREFFIEDVADAWMSELEIAAPKGPTGVLAASHYIQFMGGAERRVLRAMNTAPYAGLVASGTAPHPILPRRPAYALFWVGAAHPVARVNHPGTKPNPWMDVAAQAVQARMPELFQTFVRFAREVWGAGGGE